MSMAHVGTPTKYQAHRDHWLVDVTYSSFHDAVSRVQPISAEQCARIIYETSTFDQLKVYTEACAVQFGKNSNCRKRPEVVQEFRELVEKARGKWSERLRDLKLRDVEITVQGQEWFMKRFKEVKEGLESLGGHCYYMQHYNSTTKTQRLGIVVKHEHLLRLMTPEYMANKSLSWEDNTAPAQAGVQEKAFDRPGLDQERLFVYRDEDYRPLIYVEDPKKPLYPNRDALPPLEPPEKPETPKIASRLPRHKGNSGYNGSRSCIPRYLRSDGYTSSGSFESTGVSQSPKLTKVVLIPNDEPEVEIEAFPIDSALPWVQRDWKIRKEQLEEWKTKWQSREETRKSISPEAAIPDVDYPVMPEMSTTYPASRNWEWYEEEVLPAMEQDCVEAKQMLEQKEENYKKAKATYEAVREHAPDRDDRIEHYRQAVADAEIDLKRYQEKAGIVKLGLDSARTQPIPIRPQKSQKQKVARAARLEDLLHQRDEESEYNDLENSIILDRHGPSGEEYRNAAKKNNAIRRDNSIGSILADTGVSRSKRVTFGIPDNDRSPAGSPKTPPTCASWLGEEWSMIQHPKDGNTPGIDMLSRVQSRGLNASMNFEDEARLLLGRTYDNDTFLRQNAGPLRRISTMFNGLNLWGRQ